MPAILFAAFADLLLLPACWLCGEYRTAPLILLAAGNMLFYLILLLCFLRRFSSAPGRRGALLEFVLIQFFLCAGIFLYKLTDIILIRSST